MLSSLGELFLFLEEANLLMNGVKLLLLPVLAGNLCENVLTMFSMGERHTWSCEICTMLVTC